MQPPSNRSGLARASSSAAALVILLTPFSASAQSEGAAADPCALPPFLQAVLPDREPWPRTMERRVLVALDGALAALNEQKYEEAKLSVGELDFARLTRYELGMAEAVLYRIANAEGDYAAARQHLVNSIASCGLSEQGVAEAREAIERIDERLAQAPAP